MLNEPFSVTVATLMDTAADTWSSSVSYETMMTVSDTLQKPMVLASSMALEKRLLSVREDRSLVERTEKDRGQARTI